MSSGNEDLNLAIYGQPEAPVPLIPLRAGPLETLFDPASGFLRRIKLGDQEVIRGIYAAVRDHNWGTVPATLHGLQIHVNGRVLTVKSGTGEAWMDGDETKNQGERKSRRSTDSFEISFRAEHRQGEIHFVWNGTIQGTPDGTIRYEFDGEAQSDFLRNRIGLCVLHPIRECAGTAARQTRTNGEVIECRFPDLIEPQIFGQASFRDLRAVAHEMKPDLWAEVTFEGDVFEIEDQRNWTDASFKTYGTPLTIPFPVQVRRGDRIAQSVTLALQGKPTVRRRSEKRGLVLTIPDGPTHSVPRLGVCEASHGLPLTEKEIWHLSALQLSHLRVDIRLGGADWQRALERAVENARTLKVVLELAVHLDSSGGGDLPLLSELLRKHRCRPARILALREGEAATSRETFSAVRKGLRLKSVAIAAGSDANFCELHREQALGHAAVKDADAVFWPINPQVHAFDHLSIIETLEAQPHTVRTARAHYGDRPVIISPVTLKPRFNAVATSADVAPFNELPSQVDPRQTAKFAAVWTFATIAGLANAGVDSITLYETTGWRGLFETERGSLQPDKFPSQPGEVFPLYEMLEAFADVDGIAPLAGPHTTEVVARALYSFDRIRVLIANLTDRERDIRLRFGGDEQGVKLRPYGIVWIDVGA